MIRSTHPFLGISRTYPLFALFCGLALFCAGPRTAAQEKQLLSLTYADGEEPVANLILDPKGNLFGTAKGGGTHGQGDAFEFIHQPNGSFTFKIIHAFGTPIAGTLDGFKPEASLIRDAKGNLYGTTYGGGKHGKGTVFELTPESNGSWTENILYSFGASATDGFEPLGGVVRDAKGHLFGTTYLGGKYGDGTVFELTPKATGEWTETILQHFGLGVDGINPRGNLAIDAKGHIYGVTFFGQKSSMGTVFELTPQAGGGYTEKVIYPFGNLSTNPNTPNAGVILDSKGNLYGTSMMGGQAPGQSCPCGTVFELLPAATGPWTEKTLYRFKLALTDGHEPESSLTFDAKGNLYGTTYLGGAHSDGTVFELSPSTGGKWTEKILYDFGRNASDGVSPAAGVVRDAAGNLYGTTFAGGQDHYGTVFEIVAPKAAYAPLDEPDEEDSQQE